LLQDTPLFADGLDDGDIEGPVAFGNVYDDGKAARDVSLTKSFDQMTYEEVLTYYLQRYWSVSEESTSRLCQRVQKWEERMVPILEEEESRREFSIHEYGDEVLGKFQQIGQTIPFVEWMLGLDEIRLNLVGIRAGTCFTIFVQNKLGCEKMRLGRYISFDLILFARLLWLQVVLKLYPFSVGVILPESNSPRMSTVKT
uniref:Condensin-2 complex subunit H2 C-terminal domain-containing protein n=1 Tax=Parascaris equorum TaxID=6256 RepID=A0A914RMI5_PAREQ